MQFKVENYDIESLRKDLVGYMGAAVGNPSWVSITNITKAENIEPDDLLRMAKENNFNLNNYKIK